MSKGSKRILKRQDSISSDKRSFLERNYPDATKRGVGTRDRLNSATAANHLQGTRVGHRSTGSEVGGQFASSIDSMALDSGFPRTQVASKVNSGAQSRMFSPAINAHSKRLASSRGTRTHDYLHDQARLQRQSNFEMQARE